MDNMSNSIGNMFDGDEEATETHMAAKSDEMAETIVAAGASENCPSVQIMADLKSMYEFLNFDSPTENTRISQIEIMDVKADCTEQPEAIAMTIDITFDGQIGAQARTSKDNTANFSYPYFIAVTDADGKILAKEIFAASLSYSKDQDSIKQIETINQLLPKSPAVADYNVLLGFQLNEEQLIYNRTQVTPAAGGDEEVAATVDTE